MNVNYPQYILNFLFDAVFPVKCISCGKFSPKNRKDYLCEECAGQLPLNTRFECIGCKKTAKLGRTCFECPEFRDIDHLLIVSSLNDRLLEKTIKTFKYRFVIDIASAFRKLLKKYIFFLGKDKKFSLAAYKPLIIPVPSHSRRLNWRGFDHTLIIAEMAAEIILAETKTGILIRSKNSRPQAEIRVKDERMENIKNKFSLTSPDAIKERAVILVDDICTTGATLKEAASILKKNGASKIICLVIARG